MVEYDSVLFLFCERIKQNLPNIQNFLPNVGCLGIFAVVNHLNHTFMTAQLPQTHILGYPRIGARRELKKSVEAFWQGTSPREELLETARRIRSEQWQRQKAAGIDFIPSNDFSFYDQVLDLTLCLGAVPQRYASLRHDKLKLYFAMAHGTQKEGRDIIAMEMTKWFDTNYHYIVPEFTKDQTFSLFDSKPVDEFLEARAQGIFTTPVLIGPVTYLLLGKEKEDGFHRLQLLDRLLPVYVELLRALENAGAAWVQIDEPFLVTDLDEEHRAAYRRVYSTIAEATGLRILLTSYFGGLGDNLDLAASLPVEALHIDLARSPEQLDAVLSVLPMDKTLALGLVDGRNVWKNDFEASRALILRAIGQLGVSRVMVSASSSFLHVPYDLAAETRERQLPADIKRWLAFTYEKTAELTTLRLLSTEFLAPEVETLLAANRTDMAAKQTSPLIHNAAVEARVGALTPADARRNSPFTHRQRLQHEWLHLPLFPTTTIGSFPQTAEVRSWRAQFKKGILSSADYHRLLREETERCIRRQEEMGIDVLVHGEFERNDMVEYFGEQLSGFAFTQNGWVQSYGSRCVKPPIIYGDVSRPTPMTVEWSSFAQSLTSRPLKGMLTGPVTILEWSFVRNDQPRSITARQIALAIRDEVEDLERAGIRIIQIDEPAIREGLPLRRAEWDEYLDWAVECFRISASGVADTTQIHTHMCYSEFNDIIEHIARMDADVITIECSRSQMELLDVFRDFKYPNEIGPGVYDIHSSRVPSVEEMVELLRKAAAYIPPRQLWSNPDCGLKTRGWKETSEALDNMIEATRQIRREFASTDA